MNVPIYVRKWKKTSTIDEMMYLGTGGNFLKIPFLFCSAHSIWNNYHVGFYLPQILIKVKLDFNKNVKISELLSPQLVYDVPQQVRRLRRRILLIMLNMIKLTTSNS